MQFSLHFLEITFGWARKKTYKLHQFSSLFSFLTKNSKIPILLHFSLSLSFSSSLKSLQQNSLNIRDRTVQKTRRPAQPGQPAHVRPAATRSEDSDGRTRVPAKLTRPLTGRLSVFGFQTRNTRPEPIVYPYRRSITIFRPDPARSSRYPTKSRPDLDGSGQISVRSRRIQPDFGQISKDPVRFRPDLDGSGQISVRSRRIRLYFGQI